MNTNLVRKSIAILTGCALSFGMFSGFASGVSASMITINYAPEKNTSATLNVDYHTQTEIAAFLRSHPVTGGDTRSYSSTPVTSSPFSVGRLSDSVLNGALNQLNVYRYIAGVPANVTLDESLVTAAQSAAFISAVNAGQTGDPYAGLNHQPPKPSGFSDDLYDQCYRGAGSSNLGWNAPSVGDSIRNYMNEYNTGLGHRRWCLNPAMGKTGFGHVGAFTAMQVFDFSNAQANGYNQVAWPAQNMPVQYFGDDQCWSLSMGSEVNESSVTVRLTYAGKTYTYSTASGSDRFYVNNVGYGQTGCIVFKPNITGIVKAGNTVSVSISGQYTYGGTFTANYTVDFFDINNPVGETGWRQNGSSWMYLDNSNIVTGWKEIDGKWYYFNAAGIMQTGWVKDGGWYYFASSGKMVTGWLCDGGKWYYFSASGKMVIGWKSIDGTWYYFENSGKMATGWICDGGKWYYFSSSGKMTTGWRYIDGKWYYFEASGKMVTGWIELEGKWYFLEASGAMATNKLIGNCYVNGSGVWVE